MPQYSGKFLSGLVKSNEQPRVLQAAELNFSHSIESRAFICHWQMSTVSSQLWGTLETSHFAALARTKIMHKLRQKIGASEYSTRPAPSTVSIAWLAFMAGPTQRVSEKQFMNTAPQVFRSPKVLTLRWPAVKRSGPSMSYNAHSNAF